MLDDKIFLICIFVLFLGLSLIVGILIVINRKINRRFFEWCRPLDHLLDRCLNNFNSRNTNALVENLFSEYLQRRNEFWSVYGQVLIAVFISMLITILLLTKTISAEAGLPILSGIGSFAIAKGISSNKTQNLSKDDDEPSKR